MWELVWELELEQELEQEQEQERERELEQELEQEQMISDMDDTVMRLIDDWLWRFNERIAYCEWCQSRRRK